MRTCVQSVFFLLLPLLVLYSTSFLPVPIAHAHADVLYRMSPVGLPFRHSFSSHSASLLFLTLILSLLLDTFVHPSDRQLSTVYFIDHSQLSAQFFFFLSISRFTSTIHSFNLRIDSLFFQASLGGLFMFIPSFFFDIFNEHPPRLSA